MGLFDRFKDDNSSSSTATAVAAPASGKISLEKGQSISLDKTSSGTISAENGWSAKGKDYDLKALVRYKDGTTVYVGAANKDEKLSTREGAITHSGDAKKAGELETITIKHHPDIASVALSSYSALENGAGSFREYGVYVNIKNGSQTVGIDAKDASAKSSSYTLCFGEIVFNDDGTFTVTNLEMYSKGGSEKRIAYKGDRVVMDAGPEGQPK